MNALEKIDAIHYVGCFALKATPSNISSQLYQLLQDKNIIMKFLSIVTVTTVLSAPSAFGNKLHFENVEVSSDTLIKLSNNGLDEERTPR